VIERSGAVGLDVLVGDGAEAFYESLAGRAYPARRIQATS
jgi:hypothetical protein